MKLCQLCNKACYLKNMFNGNPILNAQSFSLKRMTVKKGTSFIKKNQAFEFLYAVFDGVFKSIHYKNKAQEQSIDSKIYQFYFLGDLIGIDGFKFNIHSLNTIAVQDSIVCVIPLDMLEKHIASMDIFYKTLMISASDFAFSSIHILSETNAKMRLLFFLTYMRQKLQIKPHQIFRLPIPKQDIANYLGIANETFSRLLKQLIEEQFIEVNGKQILIK